MSILLLRTLPTRLVFLVAAAVALPAASASAQRPDSLPVGIDVRVTPRFAADRPLTGELLEADSVGLVVGRYRRSPMQLAYSDIASVDVARGRTRIPGGAARGAKRGFLIGAAIGIVATSAAFVYDQRTSSEAFIPGTVIIGAYSVGLIAVTTATGAILGNRQRTNWERVWSGR